MYGINICRWTRQIQPHHISTSSLIYGEKGGITGGHAEFRSGSIDFKRLSPAVRALSRPLGEPYPGGIPRISLADLSYLKDSSALILGVTWTAYTEHMEDYFNPINPGEPKLINTWCNLSLSVDNGVNWVNTLPMKKYWFQWIYRYIDSPGLLKYKIKFEIDTDLLNAILLELPIFDDISIYYKIGGPQFLSWVLV
jgi:hypothetical protein